MKFLCCVTVSQISEKFVSVKKKKTQQKLSKRRISSPNQDIWTWSTAVACYVQSDSAQ